MKHIFAAFLFLVSWQEYQLRCDTMRAVVDESGYITKMIPVIDGSTCTIETVSHSIKLKNQKDVDLFVGQKGRAIKHLLGTLETGKNIYGYEWVNGEPGLIGDKAFNIKVEEIK